MTVEGVKARASQRFIFDAFGRLQARPSTSPNHIDDIWEPTLGLVMAEDAEEANIQPDPGFFAASRSGPIDVDDNDSYVFVDPLSPTLSDLSASSRRKLLSSYRSASADFTVNIWSWALGALLALCLSALPFVIFALFGRSLFRISILIRTLNPSTGSPYC